MQSQVRVTALLVLSLSSIILAGALEAQETRTVTGRVLDQSTRQPIADVVVRLHGVELAALTGEDGRFRIVGVPLGTYVVQLDHVAYGERLAALVVAPDREPLLEVRLTPRAIALDSVIVEARTELDQRRQSTGFAMNEILRPAIDEASREGLTLWELLQARMPQVRVREASRGIAACVEFRGAVNMQGGCQHMAIFVDGVPMTAPGTIYPNIPLGDLERVEAISPGQAGVQYGTRGGAGVLLIETRQGPRPGSPRDMREALVIGFDWSLEGQSYPWTKVLASSFVANAIGLGVGILAARHCLDVSDTGLIGVQDRCGGITAFATGSLAVALPVVGTSYMTRWGGGTQRSQGRIIPAAVLSSAAALTGYLLVIEGQSAAGGAFLAVGTPLVAIISDRVFRVLRP
jgi:hypothetical protein